MDLNSLVKEHTPWVEMIAKRLHSTLPAHVSFDDLMQAGLLGLIDAHKRFDPSQGFLFKTFAEYRVKGAMLDELREQDILSRKERENVKEIEKTRGDLESELKRAPTDQEIADRLKMSVERFRQLQNIIQISVDHLGIFDDGTKKSLHDILHYENDVSAPARKLDEKSLQVLSREERIISKLTYEWGFLQEEIGDLFGVTGSRVSQWLRRIHERISETVSEPVAKRKPDPLPEVHTEGAEEETIRVLQEEAARIQQEIPREAGPTMERHSDQALETQEPRKTAGFKVACF